MKFNDENYNNREKAFSTCLEKYGKTTPGQIPEFQEKRKKTCIETYGTPSPGSCRYILDGLSFDSAWELAFYVWHRDSSIKIERESVHFEYCDENRKGS